MIGWEVIGFNGMGLERCCGIWRGGNTNQSMLMTVLQREFLRSS